MFFGKLRGLFGEHLFLVESNSSADRCLILPFEPLHNLYLVDSELVKYLMVQCISSNELSRNRSGLGRKSSLFSSIRTEGLGLCNTRLSKCQTFYVMSGLEMDFFKHEASS